MNIGSNCIKRKWWYHNKNWLHSQFGYNQCLIFSFCYLRNQDHFDNYRNYVNASSLAVRIRTLWLAKMLLMANPISCIFFSFLGVNSNYTITIDRDEVWQRRMREVYIFISKSCDIVTRSSSLINSYSERHIHNFMVYSRGGGDMFIITYSRSRVTWCLLPLFS